MLEIYSLNIEVGAGDGTVSSPSIPFNNASLTKGCTVEKTAPSTIQFNKSGIYNITLDASASAAATTDPITVQLVKNGILQPQAQSTLTPAAADALGSLHFETLVQVPSDNSSCCCSIPTTVEVVNTNSAATFKNVNMCITKIC